MASRENPGGPSASMSAMGLSVYLLEVKDEGCGRTSLVDIEVSAIPAE